MRTGVGEPPAGTLAQAELARARWALGQAVAARFPEIVERTETAGGRREGPALDPEVAEGRRQEAARATRMTLDWLTQGAAVLPEEVDAVAQAGAQAVAAHSLSLAEVIRSSLSWRDTIVAVLTEEASRIGTPAQVLEETVAGIQVSWDAYLVRCAQHFDRRSEQMRLELAAAHAELTRLAHCDPLTQLANRAQFLDHLRLALSREGEAHRPLAVFFMDLDFFKALNDSFGHKAGDDALRQIGCRLAQAVRPGDCVARLGGDEFVMLGQGVDLAQVAPLAERLGRTISAPLSVGPCRLSVTASIGVALARGPGEDAEALIDRADSAMYRAKGRGRNCFEVAAP
ncbi:MAG TPA: GGDEF domain-containing protein [Acidimicrobiales bacterium]|nr:GGDEF domain-containing protein [Acidimicrobiales bacterium]